MADRGRQRTALSYEQIEKVLRLAKQGVDRHAIAERFGITPNGVDRIRAEHRN